MRGFALRHFADYKIINWIALKEMAFRLTIKRGPRLLTPDMSSNKEVL